MYLGFDFSTQQIKAIATDDNLTVVFDDHIKFDVDLPEFCTNGGVHIHDDQVTVTAPTAMWVKALDMLLDKMKTAGFDFSKVVSLSGDGQQHGSVYWKTGARKALNNLHVDKLMYDQLKDNFSFPNSPVWMDASTSKQILELQDAVGGAMELARITGSRGFERFTGNQIMKLYQTDKEGYGNTERISLVSNFAASLFLGDYAPIDLSDGSGMNLLDIRQKLWDKTCLEACAPNLASKLGDPVPSKTVIGNVSSYLVSKYGFSEDCKVVAFTGDNPASLAGLAPREGDIMVSLGSSDTVFLWIPTATPGLHGHIFVNPLDQNTFMGLVCFKNGSLTREIVMNRCAEGSWETFNEMVQNTRPGNGGHIGFFFEVPEIQPVVKGTFLFDEYDHKIDCFAPEVEARAVLESQFLSRLMYANLCGLQIGVQSRVLATGGASANPVILQVIADIFKCSVYTLDVPNSAALGNCYRAKHALMEPGTLFLEAVKHLPPPVCKAEHTPGTELVYKTMMSRYQKLEAHITTLS